MKHLVKGIGQYIKESEENDRKELASMGFSDKIQLEDLDEIISEISTIADDPEVERLEEALIDLVQAKIEQFANKFEWDEDVMAEAVEEYSDDVRWSGGVAKMAIAAEMRSLTS
jgi:hypothetical protein